MSACSDEDGEDVEDRGSWRSDFVEDEAEPSQCVHSEESLPKIKPYPYYYPYE